MQHLSLKLLILLVRLKQKILVGSWLKNGHLCNNTYFIFAPRQLFYMAFFLYLLSQLITGRIKLFYQLMINAMIFQ